MPKKCWFLSRNALLAGIAGIVIQLASHSAQATPIQIYGAWHCGNDACTWGTVRDMTDFDNKNHWMIDRGDGTPSVNLVVLAFLDPLKLLNRTSDAQTVSGVPIGMNAQVVSYFTSKNIRVMLAIGGITFVSNWNSALASNPTQLGLNAAAVAKSLGVGIEIDYEENITPNLTGLQAFLDAYRSQLPYDATGSNPAARLTIDVGTGDRFLIGIDQMATSTWLTTSNPVLDYANALVPSKQPTSATAAESNWLEHVDGKPNFAPPIPPLAPAKFTGSLFITDGTRAIPECNNFSSSLEDATGSFVQTVAPAGAGTTSGMLGYMFWAGECPSTRNVCTTPPNGCAGGVGAGARTYAIPIPMPPLRQQ
ncbi:MAG TPA: hypothetical protein VKZ53_10750 [Candidatus Angelobacter sp.]|nr:hypothetical protein [Candidatus Angelobacter sp.]